MTPSQMMLAVSFLFFLPSMVFNSLAIYCVATDLKHYRTFMKEMLLSLACVDIASSLGVTVYHFIMYRVVEPPFAICFIGGFMTSFPPMFGVGIGVLMALERLVTLMAPFWYHRNFHKFRLRLPIIVVAGWCFAICVLPAFGLGKVFYNTTVNGTSIRRCGIFSKDPEMTKKESIFPLLFAGTGIMFIFMLLVCNIFVIRSLSTMRRVIYPLSQLSSKQPEFTLTKMTIVISLLFVICLLPLNIDLILTQVGIMSSTYFTRVARTLTGFNNFLSPIVYVSMITSYRKRLYRLLCSWKNNGPHKSPQFP